MIWSYFRDRFLKCDARNDKNTDENTDENTEEILDIGDYANSILDGNYRSYGNYRTTGTMGKMRTLETLGTMENGQNFYKNFDESKGLYRNYRKDHRKN